MGLIGKLVAELEFKAPPDKYFNGLVDHGALYSKALPDDLHSSEVHEGDGKTLDSINYYCYVLDGGKTAATTKAKMEAIDEENKSLTLDFFSGHIGELYRSYKLNVQLFAKDGKNIMRWTIEYEKLNEEVPEPINYLELKIRFAKGLDAHLLQA